MNHPAQTSTMFPVGDTITEKCPKGYILKQTLIIIKSRHWHSF